MSKEYYSDKPCELCIFEENCNVNLQSETLIIDDDERDYYYCDEYKNKEATASDAGCIEYHRNRDDGVPEPWKG